MGDDERAGEGNEGMEVPVGGGAAEQDLDSESLSQTRRTWENHRVPYTIFHAAELEWHPRREGDPRLVSELSESMTRSRANLYRYPPGAIGRRHSDPVQEEVFVVLDGTLTIHMGEGDEPERHELARGSVLVVQPGTALQLSNRGDDELRLFIYGAPPERGEATFLPPIE